MSMTVIMAALIALVATLLIGTLIISVGTPSSGNVTKRLARVRARHIHSAEEAVAAQMRRATIARTGQQSGLMSMIPRRELLEQRLKRTGKNWTLTQYGVASMGAFVLFAALAMLMGAPFVLSLLIAVLGGLGLPYFVLGFLAARRLAKFTTTLPDALDLIVRGLKAGLPVTETMSVIANEIPGPTGEEFKEVTEKVRIGQTLDQALNDAATRLNSTEFQFFCISLAIQRETGGNLAETLANLSDVLRKRAQMKLKVRAMSSEAKASAYIIGVLPFAIFFLIHLVNPPYVARFFVEERLMLTGLLALTWMGIGVGIMAKMIRFEI